MNASSKSAGCNTPDGLCDPWSALDSSGVGFVARMDGRPSHSIVEKALRVLANLAHPGVMDHGGPAAEGSGLLMQIPDDFMRRECAGIGVFLPEYGYYAMGMVFMPRDPALSSECERVFSDVGEAEGFRVLGWRTVPVNTDCIEERSRSSMPFFRQVFLAPLFDDTERIERVLYVFRRTLEKKVASWTGNNYRDFSIASLSSRTVVYKGLVRGNNLAAFYPDLADREFMSAFAIVHLRHIISGSPAWRQIQPYRLIAHSGEFNTLGGNITRMRLHEPHLDSPHLGSDLEKVLPVLADGENGSMCFDRVLELLLHGGRALPHAVMMLIPEAWGDKFSMGDDRRAFYEYHSAIM